MERSNAVTTMDLAPDPGDAADDWFGDGTAFNSQAELAAALQGMADEPEHFVAVNVDAPATPVDAEADAIPAAESADGNAHDADVTFELVEHRAPPAPRTPAKPTPSAQSPVEPKIATWSVRVPGVQLLPQRQPGRTGWSMQNSVRILRQADELVLRLREEAIITAFSATARALRDDDAAAAG